MKLYPKKYAFPEKSTKLNGQILSTTGSVFNFSRTDTFSVAVWFRSNGGTSIQELFSQFGGSGTRLGAFFNEATVGSIMQLMSDNQGNVLEFRSVATNANDGNWHHYVFTYSGSSIQTGIVPYLDTVPLTGAYNNDTLTGNLAMTSKMEIGCRATTAIFAKCYLTHFCVFNKQLSQAEVTYLYNSGEPIDPRRTSLNTSCISFCPLGDIRDDMMNGPLNINISGLSNPSYP